MDQAITTSSRSSVFALIREALNGSQRDLTQGNLRRAIVILAIPMILEMMMESLFGVVDIFFVARLGVDSLATVALTESVLTLVFGVALGLSMATTAFVARRIGEKDAEGAATGAVQSIVLGLILSAVVAGFGILYAPELLRLMGGTDAVVRTGTRYTQILLGGSITIFLLFLINGVFRGAGDPALSMRVLWVANGINIVLDPCLINGWWLFPRLGVMWRLLKVSFTGILQFVIATASWTALVRLCATFGTVPVAAYTVAIRIFLFLLLPCWGMSGAAATLVGQSLGAKKPERAEAAVYQTGRFTMIYMGLVAILSLMFTRRIVAFFTADPAVQEVASDCLRFISAGNVCYAWGMVLIQAFNGAGDTRTPMAVNFFCYWCFQIPLAWLLAVVLHGGRRGVFAAIPAAETAMTLASLVLFRRGAWKRKLI